MWGSAISEACHRAHFAVLHMKGGMPSSSLVQKKPKLIMTIVAFICFIWMLSAYSVFSRSSPTTDERLVYARNGAVSSENRICSEIGVTVLKRGGSAVDSSIATGLCIGTLNFYSSGIGGGGFMLIRSLSGSSQVIDFREEAAAKAFQDMFKENPQWAQTSGLGVGVPGELQGFAVAHQLYGKLTWKSLFEESIKLARNGWITNSKLAEKIQLLGKEKILSDPAFRELFAPIGRILEEGDIVKRLKYAETLELIANEGADVFYHGQLAKKLVATIQKHNGTLTEEDFANYEAKLKQAVIGFYHGKKVITCPLPASTEYSRRVSIIPAGKPQPEYAQNRTVEAFKFAYASRSYYGDTSDTDFPNMTTIANNFIDKKLAYKDRAKISDVSRLKIVFIDSQSHTLPLKEYGAAFDIVNDKGTMHLSVLTADGSAVSMTSTVNLLFGSKIIDYETGIVLNNQMDDFSIPNVPNAFGYEPSPFNFIKPRKKPLSSAVPTIVESNGQVELVVGASGGSRIISATLQTILNVLDYKFNIFKAIDDPLRMHHQLMPNKITVEQEFPESFIQELISKGHKLEKLKFGMAGVSGVYKSSAGLFSAASDPRKRGGAAGY